MWSLYNDKMTLLSIGLAFLTMHIVVCAGSPVPDLEKRNTETEIAAYAGNAKNKEERGTLVDQEPVQADKQNLAKHSETQKIRMLQAYQQENEKQKRDHANVKDAMAQASKWRLERKQAMEEMKRRGVVPGQKKRNQENHISGYAGNVNNKEVRGTLRGQQPGQVDTHTLAQLSESQKIRMLQAYRQGNVIDKRDHANVKDAMAQASKWRLERKHAMEEMKRREVLENRVKQYSPTMKRSWSKNGQIRIRLTDENGQRKFKKRANLM